MFPPSPTRVLAVFVSKRNTEGTLIGLWGNINKGDFFLVAGWAQMVGFFALLKSVLSSIIGRVFL